MSDVANSTRNTALIGLSVALIVTVGSWFFINRQTASGLERLNRLDAVWAVCKSKYGDARTASDTSRVDVVLLSAVIDSGATDAPHRCGDLRKPNDAEARKDSISRAATSREMMPRRN